MITGKGYSYYKLFYQIYRNNKYICIIYKIQINRIFRFILFNKKTIMIYVKIHGLIRKYYKLYNEIKICKIIKLPGCYKCIKNLNFINS